MLSLLHARPTHKHICYQHLAKYANQHMHTCTSKHRRSHLHGSGSKPLPKYAHQHMHTCTSKHRRVVQHSSRLHGFGSKPERIAHKELPECFVCDEQALILVLYLRGNSFQCWRVYERQTLWENPSPPYFLVHKPCFLICTHINKDN